MITNDRAIHIDIAHKHSTLHNDSPAPSVTTVHMLNGILSTAESTGVILCRKLTAGLPSKYVKVASTG